MVWGLGRVCRPNLCRLAETTIPKMPNLAVNLGLPYLFKLFIYFILFYNYLIIYFIYLYNNTYNIARLL